MTCLSITDSILPESTEKAFTPLSSTSTSTSTSTVALSTSTTIRTPIAIHRSAARNQPGYRLRLGLAVLCMSLWVPGWVAAQSMAGIGANAEVRMYVLPNCGYCDRARSHLQARQVRFTELDIAANGSAKAEFDQLGGAGTPLILIGDRVIHGFDPGRIDAALAGD